MASLPRQVTHHYGNNTSGAIVNYEGRVSINRIIDDKDEEAEMIRQFRSTDYDAYVHDVDDPHEETCQWLLDSVEFRDWYSSTPHPLCLVATPGSGKSVLAKHLLRTLQGDEKAGKRTIHFFCNRETKNHGDPFTAATILRNLIHQCLELARDFVVPHVKPKYKTSGPSLFESAVGLSRIFLQIMADPGPGEWYCVIDALDNLLDKERKELLMSFTMDPERRENGSGLKNLRLLITSRPCDEIKSKIRGLKNATIIPFAYPDGSTLNEPDLHKYIRDKVRELDRSREEKQKLEKEIIAKSSGNFKWAVSIIKAFKSNSVHPYKSLETICLPDMDGMFEKIWGRLSPECHLLIGLVTVATRPLSLTELVAMVQIENRPFQLGTMGSSRNSIQQNILDCEQCFKLQGELIHLVHPSLREFARRKWDLYRVADFHSQMAKGCLMYLTSSLRGRGPLKGADNAQWRREYRDLANELAFLEYAAGSWPDHLVGAGPDSYQKLWSHIRDLLVAEERRQLSYQIHQYLRTGVIVGGQSVLHILVRHNLENLVRQILLGGLKPSIKLELNAVDSQRRTPLWVAVDKANETMVGLLLEVEGVDCNLPDRVEGSSPLMKAVKHGHSGIVKLFLQATPGKIRWKTFDGQGRTPLWCAAVSGFDKVVELLLTRKDICESIEVKCRSQSPLGAAARKDHESVVRLLLAKGASPNSEDDRERRDPLSWAAEHGSKALLMCLLQHEKVKLDQKDAVFKQTPLQWAAPRRKGSITKLILDESRKRCGNKWLAFLNEGLMEAAKRGQEDFFELLLTQPELGPEHHQRALLLAADRGRAGIVRRLLATGLADVNWRDAEGKTALTRAAAKGRIEVVTALLETDDIDIEARDSYCLGAYDWARRSGHRAIVRLLEDKSGQRIRPRCQPSSNVVRTACGRSAR